MRARASFYEPAGAQTTKAKPSRAIFSDFPYSDFLLAVEYKVPAKVAKVVQLFKKSKNKKGGKNVSVRNSHGFIMFMSF